MKGLVISMLVVSVIAAFACIATFGYALTNVERKNETKIILLCILKEAFLIIGAVILLCNL